MHSITIDDESPAHENHVPQGRTGIREQRDSTVVLVLWHSLGRAVGPIVMTL